MQKPPFLSILGALAFTLGLFGATGGSPAAFTGEVIGIGFALILIGTALGGLVWLPVRAFKGEQAPDLKLFVLGATGLAWLGLLAGTLSG